MKVLTTILFLVLTATVYCQNSCDQANTGNICYGVSDCPPCWVYKNNKWDCYDYGGDGKCPWGWDRGKY